MLRVGGPATPSTCIISPLPARRNACHGTQLGLQKWIALALWLFWYVALNELLSVVSFLIQFTFFHVYVKRHRILHVICESRKFQKRCEQARLLRNQSRALKRSVDFHIAHHILRHIFLSHSASLCPYNGTMSSPSLCPIGLRYERMNECFDRSQLRFAPLWWLIVLVRTVSLNSCKIDMCCYTFVYSIYIFLQVNYAVLLVTD